MKKQIHIYYSGRVQGVGFRYGAGDIASQLGISGWVKNLPDGRVEVLAEADEKVLKDFLGYINQHFSSYIRDADIKWQPATDEFKDFEIRF
jgi:acylphosphatase